MGKKNESEPIKSWFDVPIREGAALNEWNTPIEGVPLSSRTEALICAVYPHHPSILFQVAHIAYEVFIDGSYQYIITPYYDVIDGLLPKIFDHLPGVNLDYRLPSYYRVNMTPVYVTERSPQKNRPDLQELLKRAGMDHYNRLEWMAKANMTYTGDSLVTRPIGFDNASDYSMRNGYLRKEGILRMLGMRLPIVIDGVRFPDEARPILLKSHLLDYEKMASARKGASLEGIKKAKEEGRYKGRKKKEVDPYLFSQALEEVNSGRMTVGEEARALGISRMTFYRRKEEYLASLPKKDE